MEASRPAMNENQALRRVVLKSTNSVPLGVRLWCCFKAHVLEKDPVRALFQVALSETRFRQMMRPLLRKYGPVELRGASRTARRLERDCLGVLWRYYKALLDPLSSIQVGRSARGLGLYARKQFEASRLPKEVFGAIASVEDDDFDALVGAKYPSLYQTGRTSGILFGPLSLVNHSCGAKYRFSNMIPRGRPDGFAGFGIIRLKGKNRNTNVLTKDDELLVNYGMKKRNFECECDECSR